MLRVENLCKKYPSFELKNVSFELPNGYIMGFIGMNGAGKTTTLKSILNIVKPDSGDITFNGLNSKEHELEIKKNIGFMLGAFDYYPRNKLKTIADVYKKFFPNWNENEYQNYMKKFKLDESKCVQQLSAGMKVKFGLALALSHNAELLIFDEPTSGLDPIARDEVVDIFHEIVENGERSILFSTHITSDLDKCADYILFIKNGKIVAYDTKDDLIAKHLLIEGTKDQLTDELKSNLISYKPNHYGFTGLILKENFNKKLDIKTEIPNLEDIMIYYNKEED